MQNFDKQFWERRLIFVEENMEGKNISIKSDNEVTREAPKQEIEGGETVLDDMKNKNEAFKEKFKAKANQLKEKKVQLKKIESYSDPTLDEDIDRVIKYITEQDITKLSMKKRLEGLGYIEKLNLRIDKVIQEYQKESSDKDKDTEGNALKTAEENKVATKIPEQFKGKLILKKEGVFLETNPPTGLIEITKDDGTEFDIDELGKLRLKSKGAELKVKLEETKEDGKIRAQVEGIDGKVLWEVQVDKGGNGVSIVSGVEREVDSGEVVKDKIPEKFTDKITLNPDKTLSLKSNGKEKFLTKLGRESDHVIFGTSGDTLVGKWKNKEGVTLETVKIKLAEREMKMTVGEGEPFTVNVEGDKLFTKINDEKFELINGKMVKVELPVEQTTVATATTAAPATVEASAPEVVAGKVPDATSKFDKTTPKKVEKKTTEKQKASKEETDSMSKRVYEFKKDSINIDDRARYLSDKNDQRKLSVVVKIANRINEKLKEIKNAGKGLLLEDSKELSKMIDYFYKVLKIYKEENKRDVDREKAKTNPAIKEKIEMRNLLFGNVEPEQEDFENPPTGTFIADLREIAFDKSAKYDDEQKSNMKKILENIKSLYFGLKTETSDTPEGKEKLADKIRERNQEIKELKEVVKATKQ